MDEPLFICFYLVSAQAINRIAEVTVEQYDFEADVLFSFLVQVPQE
jgi:hypothetical protein